jgi:hypothetical protein
MTQGILAMMTLSATLAAREERKKRTFIFVEGFDAQCRFVYP